MRWGVRHADGHVETWTVVTTREAARQAAEEENEDCPCGGPHRVANTACECVCNHSGACTGCGICWLKAFYEHQDRAVQVFSAYLAA